MCEKGGGGKIGRFGPRPVEGVGETRVAQGPPQSAQKLPQSAPEDAKRCSDHAPRRICGHGKNLTKHKENHGFVEVGATLETLKSQIFGFRGRAESVQSRFARKLGEMTASGDKKIVGERSRDAQ